MGFYSDYNGIEWDIIILGQFHQDLTTTEPWKSLVKKGNHPQMALIQLSEL